MSHRLMLLDTASLYFRAFYGVPDTIRRADGTPVNAVRGLLDMIARLTTDYGATHLVACWDDDWRPQWRVDLIPGYKSHRVAEVVAGAPDVEVVPDALQARLLRVLDDGEYHRLGDGKARTSDFRLVALTLRSASSLRTDLAARLTQRVHLPGLDQRVTDIPLLVRHIVRKIATEDTGFEGLLDEVRISSSIRYDADFDPEGDKSVLWEWYSCDAPE